MNSKADALVKAKKRIETLAKQMTDRALEMAAEVEALLEHATPREARHFLKTSCGMPTSDLGTYVKFSTTLKGAEHILRTGRVPFAVMKSLVALDEDTRAEALTNIASGAHLDTRDIASLRRRRRREATSFVESQERERRVSVAAAVKRRSATVLSSLDENTIAYMSDAADFHRNYKYLAQQSNPLADPTYMKRFQTLTIDGVKLLAQFEEIFGSAPDAEQDRRVARAHQALKRFASGRFSHAGGWGFDEEAFDFKFVDILAALQVLTKRPSKSPWLYRTRPSRLTDLTEIPKRFRSLELCAGLGGMAMGLEQAGFDSVALVEMDADAAATMRANRPDWNVIEKDLNELDYSEFAGKIDLLSGGIPCQPYSRNGHALGKNDPRDLFPQAVKIVAAVKPKAFLFENVRGFLDAKHADHRAAIFAGFADAGYVTRVISIDAKDYGIAQERARVFVVGMSREHMAHFRPPQIFPGWRVTLGDALEDLMASGGWSDAGPWSERRRTQVIVRDGKIEIGALASTLIGEKRNPQEKEADRWGLREIAIGRTWPHPPTDQMARLHGPNFMPGLTIEMKLRLMGLPDELKVIGEEASRSQQIGNAVVPRIAQAIGLAVYSAIGGVEFDLEHMLRIPRLPYEIEPVRRAITPPPLELESGLALDLAET